jgi:hypothetical protein
MPSDATTVAYDNKTDAEFAKWTATDVMGWIADEHDVIWMIDGKPSHYYVMREPTTCTAAGPRAWNPRTDANHAELLLRAVIAKANGRRYWRMIGGADDVTVQIMDCHGLGSATVGGEGTNVYLAPAACLAVWRAEHEGRE